MKWVATMKEKLFYIFWILLYFRRYDSLYSFCHTHTNESTVAVYYYRYVDEYFTLEWNVLCQSSFIFFQFRFHIIRPNLHFVHLINFTVKRMKTKTYFNVLYWVSSYSSNFIFIHFNSIQTTNENDLPFWYELIETIYR